MKLLKKPRNFSFISFLIFLFLFLVFCINDYNSYQKRFLEVQIESSYYGPIELFYNTGAGFNENQKRISLIRPGVNSLVIKLSRKENISGIRLDPPIIENNHLTISKANVLYGNNDLISSLNLSDFISNSDIINYKYDSVENHISFTTKPNSIDPQISISNIMLKYEPQRKIDFLFKKLPIYIFLLVFFSIFINLTKIFFYQVHLLKKKFY